MGKNFRHAPNVTQTRTLYSDGMLCSKKNQSRASHLTASMYVKVIRFVHVFCFTFFAFEFNRKQLILGNAVEGHTYGYYSVPNKRTGSNMCTGWNFDKNQISVQSGILFKILEYRVKTGNFINNKKDF